MNVTERPPATSFGAGHIAAAAIAALVVYALVGGIEGSSRDFVVLGALRIVLFAALLAFALAVEAHAQRLGRIGLGIAAVGAVSYLAAGIGAVATDGWSFEAFATDNEIEPPWYGYMLGLGWMLFAVGTVLVGIAGRSGGRLAVAVILGGILFPVVFALEPSLGFAGAHIVWLVPWMALAAGLIAAPTDAPKREVKPAQAR